MKAWRERLLHDLGDEESLPSDLLAGWLHGTLTEAERARVERLAPAHPALESTLRVASEPPASRRASHHGARRVGLALAAAALVLTLVRLDGPSLEARASRALRSGDVGGAAELLFGGRGAAWPVPTTRSGAHAENELHVLEPYALCFEARPRFSWTPAGSSGPWRLRLIDEAWNERASWIAASPRCEWPTELDPPAPGSLLLLEIRDVLHPDTVARQVFRVVEEERRAALADALAALEPSSELSVDRLRRAWCRALHRDLAGAADELAALVELLGEDALPGLVAVVGEDTLAQVRALSEGRARGGRAAGPP